MSGETDLTQLIKSIKPKVQEGDYVFISVKKATDKQISEAIGMIKEAEGITLVMEKEKAQRLGLSYEFVAAWITLTVHSSLEAVGLTAAFSTALAENNISCNVMAGYYHDHLFVNKADAEKAIQVLNSLSES